MPYVFNPFTGTFDWTGSGDVVGPSSATDNAIALFDSTTGKLIKNSFLVSNSNRHLTTDLSNWGFETVGISGGKLFIQSQLSPITFTLNYGSNTGIDEDVVYFGNSASGNFVFNRTVESPNVLVNDSAYGAGWNGSNFVPTRNAIYDKIEAMLSGTANQIAYFSSSNVVNSLSTATYPSLTELSYVKGVTSAIQTQLDGKLTGNQTITLSGDVTGSGATAITATISNSAVTYAKIQNVSATDRLLGRFSAGAGVVEEVVCTAAGRALIDDADATAQRATLGLGTLATQSGTFSGTSSGTNTGDQNLFSTISIAGQSDVIADTTSDTLTLVAGSNITLTTNATTDTITIAAAATGGSPAGSNTQVQYNNSGSFGADAGLTYSTSAGLVGNDTGGTAVDMRWETDTKTHAFFVDASENQVNIGYNSAPSANLRSLNVYENMLVTDPLDFSLGTQIQYDQIVITQTDYSSTYSNGNIYHNDSVAGRFFDITFDLGFRTQDALGNFARYGAQYWNMSSTSGAAGYGVRNNSGVVEAKNSGGSWLPVLADDTSYAASWNGSLRCPTKNAVYDKIETLVSNAALDTSWGGVTTVAPSQNAIFDVMPRHCNATAGTITATTLTDIPGLSIALVAGTWLFEAQIHAQSSTTAGIRFGVNYSGSTTSIEANFFGQLATTTLGATARITAINTASTTVGTTANVETKHIITGVIVVTDSGNLTIRGLKVTSGTLTHRLSSWLKVVRRS